MLITGMMKGAAFMDCHAECVVSVQNGLSSEPHTHIYLIILDQRILNPVRPPQVGLAAVACQAANVISHCSGLSVLCDAAIGKQLSHIGGLTGGHQLVIVHRVHINIETPVRQQGVVVLQNPGPGDVPDAALKKKLKGILKLDLHVPADQPQAALLDQALDDAVVGHLGKIGLNLVVDSACQAQLFVMTHMCCKHLCKELCVRCVWRLAVSVSEDCE